MKFRLPNKRYTNGPSDGRPVTVSFCRPIQNPSCSSSSSSHFLSASAAIGGTLLPRLLSTQASWRRSRRFWWAPRRSSPFARCGPGWWATTRAKKPTRRSGVSCSTSSAPSRGNPTPPAATAATAATATSTASIAEAARSGGPRGRTGAKASCSRWSGGCGGWRPRCSAQAA